MSNKLDLSKTTQLALNQRDQLRKRYVALQMSHDSLYLALDLALSGLKQLREHDRKAISRQCAQQLFAARPLAFPTRYPDGTKNRTL